MSKATRAKDETDGEWATRVHAFYTRDPLHSAFATRVFGVPTMQFYADLCVWERLFCEHRELAAVIELGTAYGGLSLFLALWCRQAGLRFDTYDWNPRANEALDTPLGKLVALGASCHALDLRDTRQAGRQALDAALRREGRAPLLLLCDGGDKAWEFGEFGRKLKPNDLIGVHDYGFEFGEEDLSPLAGRIAPLYADLTREVAGITRFFEITTGG